MKFDEKLKKQWREKLSAWVDKAFAKDEFLPLELLTLMRDVTTDTGMEVGVLLSRKGRVLDVMVGDKTSVELPTEFGKAGRGFCGVRVVHTHPSGNSTLSQLDKSALKNNLFDCMCAVGVKDGKLTSVTTGFVTTKEGSDELLVESVSKHDAVYINKYGFLEQVLLQEKDYVKNTERLHKNRSAGNLAILVAVEINKSDDLVRDMQELNGLAETAGIEVVGELTQKRDKPDGKYFVGAGKLMALKNMVQNTGANLVIFENELTGSKQANLAQALGVDVITRSMLILDIFAGRARTSEGKLQVELAQLKYLLPRLNSIGRSTQTGSGVGMRGPGESKIELNRRILENNIKKLEKELQQVKKSRQVSRKSRTQSSKPIVSIVGYTNSGKSTLMNVLSGAGVYEKNELFATLDTTTRNVWLQQNKEILLIDTVGFINKLPHEFIHAFSSTLEESVFANLLLVVLDVSDKDWRKHLQVVQQVLSEIGADAKQLLVYNKVDKLNAEELEELQQENQVGIYISARTGHGMEILKQTILNLVF